MKRTTLLLSFAVLIALGGTAWGGTYQIDESVLPHARVPFLGNFGVSGTGPGEFSEPTDVKANPFNGNIVVGTHLFLPLNL